MKGNVINPLSMVQYLFVQDSPLIYIDPLGLVSLLDGTLAHYGIEAYVKSLKPGQVKSNVYIQDYPLTVSKRGFADLVVENKTAFTKYDVYEIKTTATRNNAARNILAHQQVQGYVDAINSSSNNSAYQKAQLGKDLLSGLNGVTLPFPGNPNKYILLETHPWADPGMIYYEIITCLKKDQVVAYKYSKEDEKAWENYTRKRSPQTIPAPAASYATYVDNPNDYAFYEWINEVEVSKYTGDNFVFTRIGFPDKAVLYRYDGYGIFANGAPVEITDYVSLYTSSRRQGAYYSEFWAGTPDDALLGSLIGVGTGGVMVPVPIPGIA